MSQSCEIHFHVTQEQKDYLNSMAKSSGLTLSDYLKRNIYFSSLLDDLENKMLKQISELNEQFSNFNNKMDDLEGKIDLISQNDTNTYYDSGDSYSDPFT